MIESISIRSNAQSPNEARIDIFFNYRLCSHLACIYFKREINLVDGAAFLYCVWFTDPPIPRSLYIYKHFCDRMAALRRTPSSSSSPSQNAIMR